MLDDNQLQGLVAVITGAGGEIGAATANLMARRGARIVAVDRDEDGLLALEHELKGDSFLSVVGDVTDEESVAAYVKAATDAFGTIDIFFNNAGVEGPVALIGDFPSDGFRQVVEINLIGAFLGLKHVIPVMVKAGRGSVINTSSVAGLTGSPGLSAYNATKHAIVGLTRSAAAENARHGVRVNSVNPGPIQSRMMDSLAEGRRKALLESAAESDAAQATHDRLSAVIPAGRYGTPEEVAALVAFLASEDARFINGAVMTVDGGFTAV